MSITTNKVDNATHIIVSDRFDYGLHNEFRSAYKDCPKGTNFVIDLNRATYMDSSALGMMLLLREHAGNEQSKISIIGCNPEIKQILVISKFEKLFNIT